VPAPVSRERRGNGHPGLALAITGAALFMVVLDNLVVTTALPSIRNDLGASVEQLGWFVNAYTLTFAVLLLPGAALGDRFGRRRVFEIGLALFTLASAAAALAPGSGELVAARALQGAGAALVLPLSLTLLSSAFPAERRGVALGVWSGISGLAIALGPLVGGAVVDGISWQWIFWLNVPLGVLVLPAARAFLRESRGPRERLDPIGLVLAIGGLLGIVWGVVRGNGAGWSSPEIVGALAGGTLLLGVFLAWEARTDAPMLPLRLFRSRAFAATNAVSLTMSFGIFGSIFLLAQFLQTVQGYSAFHAGLRTLPWTLMPMFVAPIAGALSDRIGGRPLMALGLALQSIALGWLASISAVDVSYARLVVPFALAGTGMALVFAPVANVVLSSVRPEEQGKASGANNAIREVGGALGVAVLAAVFANAGSYRTGQTFVNGLVPAVWTGAGVLAVGAVLALLVPRAAGRKARSGGDEVATGSELLVGRDAQAPQHAVDDLVRAHASERG
jgi:EmrB/QacA subfamily drug resistance transporter